MLSRHTAEIDGLGTFEAPNSFPSPRRKSEKLSMKGGRTFTTATIDIFRNPAVPPRTRRTRRLLTSTGPKAEVAPDMRESVGITINLRPRDPLLPRLRASAHFFQIGGGRVSWWFSGTADLCLSYQCGNLHFNAKTEKFFKVWSALCAKYRTRGKEQEVTFLENCFSDNHVKCAIDQDTCFHFVSDMIDQLMPTYIPLLLNWSSSIDSDCDSILEEHSRKKFEGWPLSEDFSLSDPSSSNETEERFAIPGGASCEIATVRACPFNSWSFSLFPSQLTAAGKKYALLRNRSTPPESFLNQGYI